MSVKISQAVKFLFTTQGVNGSLKNADALPTGAYYEDGVIDGGVTVTIANLSTGLYTASFTVAAGATDGQQIDVLVNATVDSVSGAAVVFSETLDNKRNVDLNDFDQATETVDIGKISGDATAADNLEELMDGMVSGTVNDAAASQTVFIVDLPSTANNTYNDQAVKFGSGNLAGITTRCTDYVGATKTMTVLSLPVAPDDASQIIVFGRINN